MEYNKSSYRAVITLAPEATKDGEAFIRAFAASREIDLKLDVFAGDTSNSIAIVAFGKSEDINAFKETIASRWKKPEADTPRASKLEAPLEAVESVMETVFGTGGLMDKVFGPKGVVDNAVSSGKTKVNRTVREGLNNYVTTKLKVEVDTKPEEGGVKKK